MGLSAIFDPIVMAYYENQQANSGVGIPFAGWKCAPYFQTLDYPTLDGMKRISDYTPTIEELQMGFAVVQRVNNGNDYDPEVFMCRFYQNEETGIVMAYHGTEEESNPLFFAIPDGLDGLPPGIYEQVSYADENKNYVRYALFIWGRTPEA